MSSWRLIAARMTSAVSSRPTQPVILVDLPFSRSFVVLEEVGDLLGQDHRQVAPAVHARIEGVQLVDRHGQDLFVRTGFIDHHQGADRTAANDRARHHRGRTHHHDVGGVAIVGQGVGDEAVIGRIEHRRVQEAVHQQGAAFLVDLVLHRLAALRDLDDGVEVVGRVHARGDLGEVHYDSSVEWAAGRRACAGVCIGYKCCGAKEALRPRQVEAPVAGASNRPNIAL